MGERAKALEDMLDLSPPVRDVPRRLHGAQDGVDDGGPSTSAPLDHEAAQLPRTGSPDFAQLIDGDQDSAMLGILTSNNCLWSAEPHEVVSPSRVSAPLALTWDDFQISHPDDGTADDTLLQHEGHFEGHLDRDIGQGSVFAGDSHELIHGPDDKENGNHDDKRRSSRKRKGMDRFDPGHVGASAPRSGKETATGRSVQKRASRLKEEDEGLNRAQRMPPPSLSPSGTANSVQRTEILQRGKHVGSKPQMQKTARAGQKRWKQLLARMRAEAEEAPSSKQFSNQMSEVCACPMLIKCDFFAVFGCCLAQPGVYILT